MSKSLRLSEKWFQRGLWLVAFAFAGFLIGLGGKVVSNISSVESVLTLEQFIDRTQGPPVRDALKRAERNMAEASDRLDQARQKHQVALANSRVARETFENWLATRHATARPDQDPDLIARTRDLDALKAAERKALSLVEAQQQALLDATQAQAQAAAQLRRLQERAQSAYDKEARAQELRVFLYRLMLTLHCWSPPAGCLRKSARAITGRSSGASFFLPGLPFSSNWCLICRAMGAMSVISSALS